MAKKRRKKPRIKGTDRGFMMLAKDVRRRWMQYGENRAAGKGLCVMCGKEGVQVDHIEAIGRRPYEPDDFSPYIHKMFYRECQSLCKECHLAKTNEERKKRSSK